VEERGSQRNVMGHVLFQRNFTSGQPKWHFAPLSDAMVFKTLEKQTQTSQEFSLSWRIDDYIIDKHITNKAY
jgi:hypothetical protein